MKILLEAPILTQSGYGEHARLVFESIITQESADVYVNPLNWGNTPWTETMDPDLKSKIDKCIEKLSVLVRSSKEEQKSVNFDMQIHVGIPSEFEKKAPYSICVTAGIETDRVSPEWLIRTHKGIDKIIVPSQHSKNGFVNTRYEVQSNKTGQKTIMECNCGVDVIPYPVKNVQPKSLDFETTTSFNFLSVALLGPRKNIENMIRWFAEEFENDDVGLILKTGRSKGGAIDENYTTKHLRSILPKKESRKCKIYLLHGDLEESEVHSLYLREDVNAYISATHGEGYGLPIFEAAYLGLPIVATDWSAHTEFLSAPYKESGKIKDKKLFAKVDYDLMPIEDHVVWKDILVEGSQWAYPKKKSFKDQMRKIYKNHGMYKKWANELKSHVTEVYSQEQIIDKFKKSIFENFKTVENTTQEYEKLISREEGIDIQGGL